MILSACSPFFKKLLSNNPHSHPLICKKGVSSSSLAAVTNFLYLGESSIFQEELDSFLALAKELQLRGLDGSCEVKEVKSRHRFMQPKGRQSLIKHNVFLRKRFQIWNWTLKLNHLRVHWWLTTQNPRLIQSLHYAARVIVILKILFFQLLHGFKLFHLVSDFQNSFCFWCATLPSAVHKIFRLHWEF